MPETAVRYKGRKLEFGGDDAGADGVTDSDEVDRAEFSNGSEPSTGDGSDVTEDSDDVDR